MDGELGGEEDREDEVDPLQVGAAGEAGAVADGFFLVGELRLEDGAREVLRTRRNILTPECTCCLRK